jgi:NAD(P)H-hydrate repair Nnr-like enzyme with NAD(P)H-hydrate dehydratase domain
LKRLIGTWKDDYEKLEKVKKFSKKHDIVVIIKGAFTTVVYSEELFINSTGNPGMATAGSGDVLTGVITGLLCQGYDILQASILGVYLHGLAGNITRDEMGYEAIMANDIVDNLGQAYLELFENELEEFDEDWE